MIFRGAWNKYCYSLSWCNEKSSSFIKIVDLDTDFLLFLFFFWIGGVRNLRRFQHVEVLVCLPIQWVWNKAEWKQNERERDREEKRERERRGYLHFIIPCFVFVLTSFSKREESWVSLVPPYCFTKLSLCTGSINCKINWAPSTQI